MDLKIELGYWIGKNGFNCGFKEFGYGLKFVNSCRIFL
jgi:hypothetical protein